MDRHAVAKQIVAEIAPDESELFSTIWSEFDADPDVPLSEVEVLDHSLGAGARSRVQTWTTFVIFLVAQLDVSPHGAVSIEAQVANLIAAEVRKGTIPVGAPELDQLPEKVARIVGGEGRTAKRGR